ncbi:c-type cytochrome [Pseudorhodobacter aquimaris]|uniref:c-type cytochrome n=1 Tax=Pseudorhodobacter aquimaris TaxID=687412 RepID=UPI00067D7F16|nr:cytochrome c [Pseudorhodobacter aquimaris]
MRFAAKAIILGLTLTAGAALAKEGVEDPTVKARMDVMGIVGASTKVLGDMAQGKAAFDASAAAAAQTALAAAAAEIPAVFEEEADDPVSEARPDIWMNMEGFVEKAKAMEGAANAIDVTSLEGIQAGMGPLAASCKSCHSDFRAKK